jgi:hypothetical protein
VIEQQRTRLEEVEIEEKERKKEITKLHKQQLKMSSKVESVQENTEALLQLQAENQQLKRLEAQNNRLKDELSAVKKENRDLGEILKDKEELTRTVELLIEENRRYKMHQVTINKFSLK